MAKRNPNRTGEQAVFRTGTPDYIDLSSGTALTGHVKFSAKATDDSWSDGDEVGLEIKVDNSNYKIWVATWDATGGNLELSVEEETVGTISNGAIVDVTAVITQGHLDAQLQAIIDQIPTGGGTYTDEYWLNTTLLIQPDDTSTVDTLSNGDPWVCDLSDRNTQNIDISPFNDVYTTPVKFKYSVRVQSGTYIQGTGKIISGHRPWTIETWWRFPTSPITSPEEGPIFTIMGPDGRSLYLSLINTLKLRVRIHSVTGFDTSITFTCSTVLTMDTWYHIALTHDGSGNVTLWLNGVSDGSVSNKKIQIPCQFWYINRDPDNTGHQWDNPCYFEGFRVTDGVARYSTTFTPATARWDIA